MPSANLVLPYIAASQAQKHVTHNEAVRMLDALVQLAVADRHLAAPPGSPADGIRYIVAGSPTGAWAGQANKIAAYQDGAWAFYTPREGWRAWVSDEDIIVAWDGSTWVSAGGGGGGGSVNPTSMVGIVGTADSTNRLLVKSDAIYMGHDDVTPGTGDIRVKYNKSAAAKTASFLFQDSASGRAEVGLTGDNNLHFKTSPDGTTWTDAMIIDAATGIIGIGATPYTTPGVALWMEKATNIMINCANTNASSAGGGGGVALYSKPTPAAAGDRLGLLAFGSSFGNTGGANAAVVAGHADGAWTAGSATPAYVRIETTTTGSTARTERLRIESAGHTRPGADNTYTLGTSGNRWSTVYAATGSINTSDERLKDDIAPCPLGLDFIQSLNPVTYRWKIGGNEIVDVERVNPDHDPEREQMEEFAPTIREGVPVPKPGTRKHVGLIAQDVKAALDAAGVDCGMWVLDDKNDAESTQSIRYDQLIAPLIQAVKELSARVDALSAR